MKKEIIIAVASFVLGSATIVGANQAIQAIQNDQIKINLNGQVQTFKDESTGEVQYPLTYHDRTYLPLRNVAQLAGLYVDYDGNTQTVLLSSSKDISSGRMNDYIIKDSDTKVIDQYEHLSYDKLMFAKNEIFARYGYDFSSLKIRSYFDLQDWYKPAKGKTIGTDQLNSVEQQNVKILDDEIQRRLKWVNEGNLIKELSMPDYYENTLTIDKLLKWNNIDVQKLSIGSYDYKINGLKIGNDNCQLFIHFEINEISEYGYRSTTNTECYLLKDSKIIFDFSADGEWGSTDIDDVGEIAIFKDYVVNITCGAGDFCEMRVFDKDGALLFIDTGLAINVVRTGGKLFETVYDEPAGYLEGAIGDYNYYKSIYELYMKDGEMVKRRVGMDYSSVIFTAQT